MSYRFWPQSDHSDALRYDFRSRPEAADRVTDFSGVSVPDDDPLYVDCGPHGKRVATVVCWHMVDEKDSAVGFIENSSEPNDLQAWCDACESLFLEEGDMTERFREFNNMMIVCAVCYAELKDRHCRPVD